MKTNGGEAGRFAKRLRHLLKQVTGLWRERRAGPAIADYDDRVRVVKTSITDHLRHRKLTDRDNQRLLNELGRCHDAGSLVRFLDDPSVEPTNNRAERALRPAVIAQKVSQCTKNARGSRAFEAWTSVVQTLSRTTPRPAFLDALVRLAHPAVAAPT